MLLFIECAAEMPCKFCVNHTSATHHKSADCGPAYQCANN